MSTAGKTTDSTRLKLKETKEELTDFRKAAQIEIDTLRKALSHQTSPPPSAPPPESTNPQEPENAYEDMHADDSYTEEFTEAQAITAAIHRRPRDIIDIENNTMEEDLDPIYIGSSSSESSEDPSTDHEEHNDPPTDQDEDQDAHTDQDDKKMTTK